MLMKQCCGNALQPTLAWAALFGQHPDYTRFACNWAVSEFRTGPDVGVWLTERTLRSRWNKAKVKNVHWGAKLAQNLAKYTITDLRQAAEGQGEYRRKVKGGKYPGRQVRFPASSVASTVTAFEPTTDTTRRRWTARGHPAQD